MPNAKIPLLRDGKPTNDYTWNLKSKREDHWLHAMGYMIRAAKVFIDQFGEHTQSYEHVAGDITEDVEFEMA
jgi:hypothetical protein